MDDRHEWGKQDHSPDITLNPAPHSPPGDASWTEALAEAWPKIQVILVIAAVFAFILFGLISPRIELSNYETAPFRLMNIVMIGAAELAIKDLNGTKKFISMLTASVIVTAWI